jgi:hypothetical protein
MALCLPSLSVGSEHVDPTKVGQLVNPRSSIPELHKVFDSHAWDPKTGWGEEYKRQHQRCGQDFMCFADWFRQHRTRCHLPWRHCVGCGTEVGCPGPSPNPPPSPLPPPPLPSLPPWKTDIGTPGALNIAAIKGVLYANGVRLSIKGVNWFGSEGNAERVSFWR